MIVTDAATREGSPSSQAPLAAALLDLLTIAQAAVDRDRQATEVCLARAKALLLADRECAGAPCGAEQRRGQLPRWQAKRLAAYIDENLGGDISSADLVAITGSSRGHFFRTFKATFGEAPFAYIVRRRIGRAQNLMLTTSKPLCQVALDCGLCDQSHLTRLFRRLTGVTPRVWCREHVRQSAVRGAVPAPMSPDPVCVERSLASMQGQRSTQVLSRGGRRCRY